MNISYLSSLGWDSGVWYMDCDFFTVFDTYGFETKMKKFIISINEFIFQIFIELIPTIDV